MQDCCKKICINRDGEKFHGNNENSFRAMISPWHHNRALPTYKPISLTSNLLLQISCPPKQVHKKQVFKGSEFSDWPCPMWDSRMLYHWSRTRPSVAQSAPCASQSLNNCLKQAMQWLQLCKCWLVTRRPESHLCGPQFSACVLSLSPTTDHIQKSWLIWQVFPFSFGRGSVLPLFGKTGILWQFHRSNEIILFSSTSVCQHFSHTSLSNCSTSRHWPKATDNWFLRT